MLKQNWKSNWWFEFNFIGIIKLIDPAIMNYKLDAEYIGRMISETTGMNVRELEEKLKHEQIKIWNKQFWN